MGNRGVVEGRNWAPQYVLCSPAQPKPLDESIHADLAHSTPPIGQATAPPRVAPTSDFKEPSLSFRAKQNLQKLESAIKPHS